MSANPLTNVAVFFNSSTAILIGSLNNIIADIPW